MTEDGGRRTEGKTEGRWTTAALGRGTNKADVRGERSEVGSQRAEDRGRMTDDGRRKGKPMD